MKRLVADPETLAWLLTRPAFQWDAANISKNVLKHGVTPEETETLLASPFVLAGLVVFPEYDEPRWMLFGFSALDKLRTMVFTKRDGELRVISCRTMQKQERRIYAKEVCH